MPQQVEPHNLAPAPGLANNTLRQIVQPSLDGTRLRLTFSNAFGDGPVTLVNVTVARSRGGFEIVAPTEKPVTFTGGASVTIQPGALVISDIVELPVTAFENLAVTTEFGEVPKSVTGHPGSRTTSYLKTGHVAADVTWSDAVTTDHWYYLSAVDVEADEDAKSIVVVGDSITDGRGSTTNQNNRWTNLLSRRLRATSATKHLAVLNQAAGGNRILRDGLGPNALARFDRDVLAQPNVKWVIIFEGVNDLGTAVGARKRGEPGASSQDLIGALRQMILRAHRHGLRVIGATITGFEGFASYSTPESEAERQTVNTWIRTSNEFDGVIDFDAITRDPANPAKLSAAVDGGDHLHPSAAGYQIMADGIDLSLFAK
jgi:lysophospholipase L1-like esterase